MLRLKNSNDQLRDLRETSQARAQQMQEEIYNTNPAQILSTVRDVGMSFGHSLNYVLEGFVRADAGRMTLEEELRQFHNYHRVGLLSIVTGYTLGHGHY